jgi:GTP-binding protein
VEFVMSAGHASECPDTGFPEIAMSGRSNVGKSSLLNALFGRKKLALVSGTPGKTQRLNYFLVNGRYYVVDLPGYGYAKAPGKQRNQWGGMMQQYLQERETLVGVVQLVDSRHEPSREDREMVQWLREEQMPFCLVGTKVDKLGSSKRQAAVNAIVRSLELPSDQAAIPWSSETGEGRPALFAWMEAAFESAGTR